MLRAGGWALLALGMWGMGVGVHPVGASVLVLFKAPGVIGRLVHALQLVGVKRARGVPLVFLSRSSAGCWPCWSSPCWLMWCFACLWAV